MGWRRLVTVGDGRRRTMTPGTDGDVSTSRAGWYEPVIRTFPPQRQAAVGVEEVRITHPLTPPPARRKRTALGNEPNNRAWRSGTRSRLPPPSFVLPHDGRPHRSDAV